MRNARRLELVIALAFSLAPYDFGRTGLTPGVPLTVKTLGTLPITKPLCGL